MFKRNGISKGCEDDSGLIWEKKLNLKNFQENISSLLNFSNIYASFPLNFPASSISRPEKQALGKPTSIYAL